MFLEILPKDAASEVERVAHRFALAAFAGEQATELGITGWEPEEATSAAKVLFQTWLKSRGTVGGADEEAAIRQVRVFLEQHGDSRFQRLHSRTKASGEDDVVSEERAVINRAGYVRPDDGTISEFFFLREVFRREVCSGFDSNLVLKALKSRNWLSETQIRTPEGPRRVYCVQSEILS
jgi:uncharacterized protein (DUF927 family)